MRMPPLPADSIHARACKLKCEKILTRPIYLIEQIEQMLYYLNLKSKKKYKKVTLKENGKKMCSICSNLGLRIKCLICPSYL